MRMIDMFAGMGNMRLGFEQAGWKCVYSIEFDKHKREIYKVIYGKEPEGNDITEIRGTDLPRAELWAFGAPCQDFSIAGLRAGLDGSRSGLVREVFRLVREKEPNDRPEWLLYENVKGMLSSNRGWDFAAIQAEMGELGYDVQWQLLNSKDFGVPQNRERVFTLGHLRARGSRKVFPIGADCKPDAKLQGQCANTVTARYYGAQAVGTYCIEREQFSEVKQLGNVMPTATRDNPNHGRVYDTAGIAPCMNKMEGGGREPLITEPAVLRSVRNEYGKEIRKDYESGKVQESRHRMTRLEPRTDGISNTLSTVQKDNLLIEPCACLTPDRLEKRQNGRRFKEPGEPMFTLTKQDIHGVIVSGIYTNASKNFQRPPLEGLSRCIKSSNHDAGIIITEATQKGYAEAFEGDSINLSMPNSKTRRGRVGKGIANTLDCACNQATLSNSRIRRLTPRECMRLQGVPDSITDKIIQAGISDTQMYRAAGDAVTVTVIKAIAERIIVND